MIKSKRDYQEFLEADRIALFKDNSLGSKWLDFFKYDKIWHFQRLLRKCEFYKNVGKEYSILHKIYYFYLKRKFMKISMKMGFSIPENVFDKGLAIVHYGTIVVNPRAKIGMNCRIHVDVVIGESGGKVGAPILGDNIYIGPGSKIFGKIQIANNCAISANSVVNKSFLNQGMLIAGHPATEVKPINIYNLIKHL